MTYGTRAPKKAGVQGNWLGQFDHITVRDPVVAKANSASAVCSRIAGPSGVPLRARMWGPSKTLTRG